MIVSLALTCTWVFGMFWHCEFWKGQVFQSTIRKAKELDSCLVKQLVSVFRLINRLTWTEVCATNYTTPGTSVHTGRTILKLCRYKQPSHLYQLRLGAVCNLNLYKYSFYSAHNLFYKAQMRNVYISIRHKLVLKTDTKSCISFNFIGALYQTAFTHRMLKVKFFVVWKVKFSSVTTGKKISQEHKA